MPPNVPTPAVPPVEVVPPEPDGSQQLPDPASLPDLDELIAMDITPVASIFTERQQRLLTEPLYSSWPGPGEGRPFLALANVGLFYKEKTPAVYPDGLLSLGVAPPPENLRAKENHSYFLWIVGKPPDAVVEVVSDRRGGEDGFKMRTYARIGVSNYVIYDPDNFLGQGVLRAFVLHGRKYEPTDPGWLPDIGLGLKEWTGDFEGSHDTWLRWCDREGHFIPTGDERAVEAQRRADDERRRAEEAQRQADDERRRAEEARRQADQATEKARRLAEKLRELGIDPGE
jgi:Uma2 family endonuclease